VSGDLAGKAGSRQKDNRDCKEDRDPHGIQ
jgi:hypothetical protein